METETIPTHILEALFVIMSSQSGNFSSSQVYDGVKPLMKDALDWVIEYGHANGLDNHGSHLLKAQ